MRIIFYVFREIVEDESAIKGTGGLQKAHRRGLGRC